MSTTRGRPAGEKTRNGGNWTEAKFKSFIKSLLRAGTIRWGPIQACKKEANVSRGLYLCAGCGETVPTTLAPEPPKIKRVKNIFVDHINPIVDPNVGFTDWQDMVERMFCEKDNLQVLCKSCHDTKSKEEAEIAKARRAKEKDG